jgi:hypothetical protein
MTCLLVVAKQLLADHAKGRSDPLKDAAATQLKMKELEQGLKQVC